MKFIRIPTMIVEAKEDYDLTPDDQIEGFCDINIDLIEYIVGDKENSTIYMNSGQAIETPLALDDLSALLVK